MSKITAMNNENNNNNRYLNTHTHTDIYSHVHLFTGLHDWEIIVTLFSGSTSSGHFDLLWPLNQPFHYQPQAYRPPVNRLPLSILNQYTNDEAQYTNDFPPLPNISPEINPIKEIEVTSSKRR
uniref:Uncharacterized protein n=1 Tax=Cacopsylla melanoneura TaxID=428564 RepID=A0A8D9DQR0_9HEMI